MSMQQTKTEQALTSLRRQTAKGHQQRQLQSEELILNQLTFDNEGKLIYDGSGILVLAQPQV